MGFRDTGLRVVMEVWKAGNNIQTIPMYPKLHSYAVPIEVMIMTILRSHPPRQSLG